MSKNKGCLYWLLCAVIAVIAVLLLVKLIAIPIYFGVIGYIIAS